MTRRRTRPRAAPCAAARDWSRPAARHDPAVHDPTVHHPTVHHPAGRDTMQREVANDAPALVTADVGVAIGAGTSVAVEAGDIVLVRSDPRDVARIVALSRATYRKMVQNLWWAAGYNIVAIPLAAGVLAPWGVVLTPAVGAVLMSLSTIVVAINAQLLRRADLGSGLGGAT